MLRKILFALIMLLPISAHAADAIVHADTPGKTLYVRIRTSPTTSVAVPMVEGTGAGAGYYVVTDAALLAAPLPAANAVYPLKVFIGVAPSTTAADAQVGTGSIRWKSTVSVDALGFPAGSSISADIATLAGVVDQIFAVVGGLTGGQSMPRINKKPDPAFTCKVSRRADGTHEATPPIRITPGPVVEVYAAIDMSPVFGVNNYVKTVGTPVLTPGTSAITVAAEGPRDTFAYIKLGGTAAAGEDCKIVFPVTMETGTLINVTFFVEVFDE